MEVGSVSSSLYNTITAASTQNARARQSEQTAQEQQEPQALQSSPTTQQAAQTNRVQPASNTSESESVVSAQTEAERNRPTVNLNGQLVGTRVNTTA